jgi:hypothetical protein
MTATIGMKWIKCLGSNLVSTLYCYSFFTSMLDCYWCNWDNVGFSKQAMHSLYHQNFSSRIKNINLYLHLVKRTNMVVTDFQLVLAETVYNCSAFVLEWIIRYKGARDENWAAHTRELTHKCSRRRLRPVPHFYLNNVPLRKGTSSLKPQF